MDGYYSDPKMVKFLMAENLALKTYLHEKGILDPEEFAEKKKECLQILEKQVSKDVKELLVK